MLSFNDDYKSFESERTVIFQWLAQLSTQCRQMREELNELQQYLNVTPSKSSASEGMTAKPLLSLPVPYEEVKPAEPAEKINTIDDMEKDAIIASLKRHAGARRKVAEELGIPERTLYRKIKEYGLEDVK
jgi:DNA-binding NtrC family response regulator